MWWEDREAYERTMASPEWKALEDDGPNGLDMTHADGRVRQRARDALGRGARSPAVHERTGADRLTTQRRIVDALTPVASDIGGGPGCTASAPPAGGESSHRLGGRDRRGTGDDGVLEVAEIQTTSVRAVASSHRDRVR